MFWFYIKIIEKRSRLLDKPWQPCNFYWRVNVFPLKIENKLYIVETVFLSFNQNYATYIRLKFACFIIRIFVIITVHRENAILCFCNSILKLKWCISLQEISVSKLAIRKIYIHEINEEYQNSAFREHPFNKVFQKKNVSSAWNQRRLGISTDLDDGSLTVTVNFKLFVLMSILDDIRSDK